MQKLAWEISWESAEHPQRRSFRFGHYENSDSGRSNRRWSDFRKTELDLKRRMKMKTKGKILVLVSSGHGLPLQDGKVYSGAGYYLNELTVPVRALMKDGYEITFANP